MAKKKLWALEPAPAANWPATSTCSAGPRNRLGPSVPPAASPPASALRLCPPGPGRPLRRPKPPAPRRQLVGGFLTGSRPDRPVALSRHPATFPPPAQVRPRNLVACANCRPAGPAFAQVASTGSQAAAQPRRRQRRREIASRRSREREGTPNTRHLPTTMQPPPGRQGTNLRRSLQPPPERQYTRERSGNRRNDQFLKHARTNLEPPPERRDIAALAATCVLRGRNASVTGHAAQGGVP